MKVTIATATLLATALAQDNPLGVPLPSDIAAYASSLQTNTAAYAALAGIFTAPQVLSVVKAAPTLAPNSLIVQFQSAVQAAIAAEPSAQQPLASSVYGRLGEYALTDGFLNALAGATTGAGTGAASATATGSGSAASATAATTPSAAPVGSNSTIASNGTTSAAGGSGASGSGAATGSASRSGSGSGGSSATGSGSGSASRTSAGPAATSSAAGGAAGLHLTGAGAALLAGGLFAVAAL